MGAISGIMHVEHLWARKLKELACEQAGIRIANASINPGTLIAIGAELAEDAKIANQIQYQ